MPESADEPVCPLREAQEDTPGAVIAFIEMPEAADEPVFPLLEVREDTAGVVTAFSRRTDTGFSTIDFTSSVSFSAECTNQYKVDSQQPSNSNQFKSSNTHTQNK
jgi:hypothetical protein